MSNYSVTLRNSSTSLSLRTGYFSGPKGPKGDQGDKGDTGDTGVQGLQGLQGAQGLKGDTGNTGNQGVKGNQGDTGDTGDQGLQGVQGDTGTSAYDEAVQNGFVGTQAEWLTSLNGQDGQSLTVTEFTDEAAFDAHAPGALEWAILQQ